MPLAGGTKLGPYEIQTLLGSGGMGEVYRATDTRLDRVVAVKVLASHLHSSPELKQRMEREARAISALNHSHICQLYDIGSQNGTDFLVMEFLEGETLASRLIRGPMPWPEVLRVGASIAEALAVAHRQGIVHRDLKPGNIMLTKSGAKLMDFGLAKSSGVAASVSGSHPPSFTATATISGPSPLSPITTAGNIVGTVQYMSPEQIEGKEADARSDIFALGAVLYEMASGKRPFEGKSQISLASAILEKDPEPVTAINKQIPASFERLLNTCLKKNPEERFQSAQDVKLELEWVAVEKSPAVPASATKSNQKERLFWVAALVVALLAGVLATAFLYHPQQSSRAIRAVINPPPKTTMNLLGDFAGPPVISPDGSAVAFAATDSGGKIALWVRPTDSLEARVLPGTDGAIFPFWSPDSNALGFFADNKLKTIDLNSNSAQILADAPFGRGGAWGPGGLILYSPNTQVPLMRANVDGGTPTAGTKIDSALHTSHRWPFMLPDGKHFLYQAVNHDPSKWANNAVYYASLDGRENRQLFRSESNAIYADGFILFARGDQLLAQHFDPGSGVLSGTTMAVVKGLANDVSTWHMDASASQNGLLVFGTGGSADWELIWADRNGKFIGTVADKLTNLFTASISPKGDRIALQIDNAQSDIWVQDLARGVRTRLTFGPVANQAPVWSPDGRWIAYNSARNGQSQLYRKPSDGSGEEELLLEDAQALIPEDWSGDGKSLLYSRGTGINWEIRLLSLDGERKSSLVVAHAITTYTSRAKISPNGRWITYVSNESGVNEIYVAAFGGGQGKWQVSANGGAQPEWSHDGKELFFMDPTFNLYSVPATETGSALQFGTPKISVTSASWSAPQVFYDVTPDGKKILLDRVEQQVSQSVTIVTDFAAGLKK
jgi:eukaryotic-like serine/threonine-protein kinase